MEYLIRRVKDGDETALAYIQTESWKVAFKTILSDEILQKCTEITRTTASYKRLLDEKIGNGYILEVDEKPHCIAWWDKARDDDMPDYAELICIHSLQDKWRKGYGTKMMDRVLSDIKAAEYSKVMLWVFTDNDRARAFYEACGFVTYGKVKSCFGTQEICYEKNL
ncbi:MAG: GNAT family N-acetyltransferase [Clostridia bacterium]|nr:GNAT family N-acetyltransferase [Clostridia bacterium]